MSDDAYYYGYCIVIILIGIVFFYGSYLIAKKKEEERRKRINARRGEWGNNICNTLINKEIALNMTTEMVRLSWGEPTTIETKEILKKGVRKRWIYGVPRKGAKYIWFLNGIVEKIKL